MIDIEKLIIKYNELIEERKKLLLRHNERGILPHVALEGLRIKNYNISTDQVVIQFAAGNAIRIAFTDKPIIAVFKTEIGLNGSKRDILTAFSILVCNLLTNTNIDDNDIYGAMLSGFELSATSQGKDSDPDWIL